MATYLQHQFGMSLKDSYALAWSGVADSKALKDATLDTSFSMPDGNTITKSEIAQLSASYKDNNPEYMKGHNVCN